METIQKTRDKILQYREEEPYISQSELSRKCNCSRQRIHQLLTAMELPLNPKDEYYRNEVSKMREEDSKISERRMSIRLKCSTGKISSVVKELGLK